MLRGDTNRFTYSCTVEYLNEKLAGQDNRIAAGAAVGATMAVRKALLDTAHKQKLEELNDQGAAALADSKALGKTAAEQEAAKARYRNREEICNGGGGAQEEGGERDL